MRRWRVNTQCRLLVAFEFLGCVLCVCMLWQLQGFEYNTDYELIKSERLRNSNSEENLHVCSTAPLFKSCTSKASVSKPFQEVNVPSTLTLNNQFTKVATYFDHFVNGSLERWRQEEQLLSNPLEKNANFEYLNNTILGMSISECGGGCVEGWGVAVGDSGGRIRPIPRPHLRARGFHHRPSKLTPPTLTGTLVGGTVGEAFRWKSYFTINYTANEHFTTESARKWVKDGQRLKSMLEKDLDFKFDCPTVLMVFLPGNSTYYIQESFRIKVNGKKLYPSDWEIDPFKHIYTYSDLKFKPGDVADYTMKVSLQKHVVRGQLQIRSL